jgi:rhamnosyl/mannosyltransferase
MADLALWMMSAERRPPFVVTWHSDVVRQRAAYRVYRPLQRWLLRHAEVVMPTSSRYLESSRQLAAAAERVRVVPLGVDFDETTDEPDPQIVEGWRTRLGNAPIVLFVGVLRYYKGLSFLLDAWARGGEPGHLVIVGAGPERVGLEAQLAASGGATIERQVTFGGRLPDADVAALRSLAAFAVMPSHLRAEAFGLGQIESMAAGLPVIACDLPTGVPEVNQHDVSGIIVPPEDPVALGDAINRLLRSSELRSVLGKGARERARALYHADSMEERIHAVYRDVLGLEED